MNQCLRDVLAAPALRTELDGCRQEVLRTLRECPMDSDLLRLNSSIDTSETPAWNFDGGTLAAVVDQIVLGSEPLNCYSLIRTAAILFGRDASNVLKNRVLSKLRHPAPITLQELESAFRSFLIVRDSEYAGAFSTFRAAVIELADTFRYAPAVRIGGSEFRLSGSGWEVNGSITAAKWGGDVFDGVTMAVGGLVDLGDEGTEMVAQVFGRFSPGAGRFIAAELEQLANCLARSHLLLENWEGNALGRKGLLGPADDTLESIRSGIESFYAAVPKKDSWAQRTRNALQLLMNADRQTNDALALALSMSAAEALLCSKKDGIADQLARNAAALLEPDKHYRIAAEKCVKALYDMRSQALHGSSVESTPEFRQQARVLAAAILNAISERNAFRRRMDYELETPTEIFESLKVSQVTAAGFDGVPEGAIVLLWR